MTIKAGDTNSKPSSGERVNSSTGQAENQEQADAKDRPPEGNPDRDKGDTPAARFIRENFKPEDRLAVVVINKRSGAAVQRLALSESIAAPDTQRWLHYMNDRGYDVYLGTNTLKEDARGRTKEDVSAIRHIYLDIDRDGDQALERLLARSDLPKPNYVLNTSRDRHQVIWKVEGFTPGQAESLQRALSLDTGADTAVTDSARVLRLPDFYNRKYDPPHLVQIRTLSQEVHRPGSFPKLPATDRVQAVEVDERRTLATPSHKSPGRVTQSERDWAYASRALERGESRESVIAAIASYRRFDKPHARRYAEVTVEKASQSLEARKSLMEPQPHSHER